MIKLYFDEVFIVECETYGKYWHLKYRGVRVHIYQNYFPYIEFEYNGWFTKYLIIDINKFSEDIRRTLTPEFYK